MNVPMPHPPILVDSFKFMLYSLFGTGVMIMYIPLLYRTVYRIVQEKESKVRSIMLMMGMRDTPYWLSWFTYYTIINTLVATVVTLLMSNLILSHSNPFMLWLILWLFG